MKHNEARIHPHKVISLIKVPEIQDDLHITAQALPEHHTLTTFLNSGFYFHYIYYTFLMTTVDHKDRDIRSYV